MKNFKQFLLIVAVSLLLPATRLLSMDTHENDSWIFNGSTWQYHIENTRSKITLGHVIENREAYIPIKSNMRGFRAFQITEDESIKGKERRRVMIHYFDSDGKLKQTFTSNYSKRKNVKPVDKLPSKNHKNKNRSSYWTVNPKILWGSLLIALVYFAVKKVGKAEKKLHD
jgi:hypothetical protein